MADEWEETILADVMDVKHGFAFPGENIRDEPPGDILLTPGNFAIGGGFKGDKFKYFDGEVPANYVLKEGDLIVTMTDLSKQADTLGFPALVPKPCGLRFLHNQRLGKVLIKNGAKLDKGFLFYLLRTAEYRHEVLASATGTTVKHTSPGRILAHKAKLPPLAEQKAIAAVLGALDDKIELNRRMNATLEAMARALFQSWFVDFDPVRAKLDGRKPTGLDPATAALFPSAFSESDSRSIPQGWSLGRLSDLITLSREGINPGEFPEEVFDHFSLPAFDNGRTPKAESGATIMSNKHLVTSTLLRQTRSFCLNSTRIFRVSGYRISKLRDAPFAPRSLWSPAQNPEFPARTCFRSSPVRSSPASTAPWLPVLQAATSASDRRAFLK